MNKWCRSYSREKSILGHFYPKLSPQYILLIPLYTKYLKKLSNGSEVIVEHANNQNDQVTNGRSTFDNQKKKYDKN